MKNVAAETFTLLQGDSAEVLKLFPDNHFDSVVTDPPYGLSFMGKKWDYDVPSTELWREVLRVLKPGGHLLSFGGTRTYHRMVVAIEDAGFDIRDQIMWIYGSGFPKSLDVSKAIDKAAGAERETGAPQLRPDGSFRTNIEKSDGTSFATGSNDKLSSIPSTAAAAKQWQGWGTALKPANEPIVLARKPLEKGLTVAENVQKWGTGALNIDGTRIGSEQTTTVRNGNSGAHGRYGKDDRVFERLNPPGRWPANVLFDEEAALALDLQSGTSKAVKTKKNDGRVENDNQVYGQGLGVRNPDNSYSDSGGASRFFYVAKSSKKDRSSNGIVNNIHPTCKPTKLMEYLIKLVCPPGGIVLDPFMGSGTTGVAAKSLGVEFIGIELSEEYLEIANRRIANN